MKTILATIISLILLLGSANALSLSIDTPLAQRYAVANAPTNFTWSYAGTISGDVNYTFNGVESSISKTWAVDNTLKSGMTLVQGKNDVAIADFDNNGIYEAIMYDTSTLLYGFSWNGTDWESNTTIECGLIASGGSEGRLDIADLENDGTYELFFVDNTDVERGYQWNGTCWETNASLVSGLAIYDFSVFDFDGDGTNTEAIGSTKGTAGTITGYTWSGGTWNSNTTIINGLVGIDLGQDKAISVQDIDGDGNFEMALGDWNGALDYYIYNGTGWEQNDSHPKFIGLPVDIGGGALPEFADIDGDGNFELFIGEDSTFMNVYEQGYSSTVSITSQNGSNAIILKAVGNEPTPTITSTIYFVGDVSIGIGFPTNSTLYASVSELNWTFNEAKINSDINYSINAGADTSINPAWVRNTSFDMPFTFNGHADCSIYDLDGDGNIEAICGDQDTWNGLEWNGTAWLSHGSSISGLTDLGSLHFVSEVADINGDGNPDITVGTGVGDLRVYSNNGTWNQNSSLECGLVDVGANSRPSMADIDEDGFMDIIAGEQGEDANELNSFTWNGTCFNSNDSFVESGISLISGSNEVDIVLQDFNKDGHVDLIIPYVTGSAETPRFFEWNFTTNSWVRNTAYENSMPSIHPNQYGSFFADIEPNSTYLWYYRATGDADGYRFEYPLSVAVSGFINGTNNITLKADGETEFVEFTIDGIPPTTTSNISAGWSNANQAVNLTCTDAESSCDIILYSINDNPFTVYSAPFLVSTEGNNTLVHYSNDSAGNIESNNTEYVAIDKTAPTISVSSPLDTFTYGINLTINISASDAFSGVFNITYAITGNGVNINNTANASTFVENQTMLVNDSAYTITVTSYDNAGNSAQEINTFFIKAQTTLQVMNDALVNKNRDFTIWADYEFATNSSDITGASCSYSGDISGTLAYNATQQRYEKTNTQVAENGQYSITITCTKAGFETQQGVVSIQTTFIPIYSQNDLSNILYDILGNFGVALIVFIPLIVMVWLAVFVKKRYFK